MPPGTDGGLVRRRLDGRMVPACPVCAGQFANVVWCVRCALHHTELHHIELHHIERYIEGRGCSALGLLQARHDARRTAKRS